MEREKVIRAVDSCFDYWLEQHRYLNPLELEKVRQFKADALALLKEQEAVEPKHNPLSPTDWFCGKCGMCISRFHNYCPSCGQEVRWE